MLAEALMALAAAGGAAVVQAAGTDAWEGTRDRLARWSARGDAERERAELERLDRSAAEIAAADDASADRVRTRQEVAWQTRIETVLEGLDGQGRAEAAAVLEELLHQAALRPSDGGGVVSHNDFRGPVAFQVGHHNQQDVHFGPQA
ncbi:hypothetical protein ABZZ20_25760 [Streptomyces sp. NPDC006430]|uniref:hypothetical protein n=1 Tax=Streptomyces sp. NPDC006430 TaxID=3154299 RepID=UPI0033B506A3